MSLLLCFRISGFPRRTSICACGAIVWQKQGFLQTTEGNVVHYGFIEKFIEKLGEKYNIREIAFDR